MSEPKTRQNDADVTAFVDSVANQRRRADAAEVIEMMSQATGLPAKMWGKAVIGFGTYDYTYASGRSGTWMRIGLSPRKQNLVLYLMDGYSERAATLTRLGKHKLGKSCLYINKLDDVDRDVLRELIDSSLAEMQRRYPQ